MQKGGSQYGVSPPEMPTFGAGSSRPQMVGNLSSTQLQPSDTTSPRPPAASRQSNFEELAATVTGNYPEDDPLGVGEEVERGVSGNRWPRQETLALLKIRSDMDATFRDATLKGPLWEEVSRKLAEQGYTRSAKKCKEKFENVHKYYKRTKDSRAARPDGKSYRFFSQLEALNSPSSLPSATATTNTNTPEIVANPASTFSVTAARVPQPTPISSIPPVPPPMAAQPVAPTDTTAATTVAGLSALGGGMSFSSNTSESESETEDEETEEGLENQHKRKREPGGWEGGGRGGNRKMMVFFEGLMKQVIERQEAMQQKFLETIEKREQDRMIREEAWRRQEMARLSHEHEVMTQERAVAASRDATIISFLQKITGQTIQLPQPVSATPPQLLHVVSIATAPPPPQQAPPPPKPASTPPPQPQQPTPQQSQSQPQPQQQQQPQPLQSLGQPQQQLQAVPPAPERQQPHPENASLTKSAEIEIAPAAQEQQIVHDSETNLASASDPTSSRWPKAEVHALINIRAGMESKYQEAGPKGPLWEEISAAMKHMGYTRNSKRCKEKWENINKYFKKVKESNKKRPEDAKTCPYFHQLDALYRSKILGISGGGGESSIVSGRMQEQQQNPDPTVLPITTLPPPSNDGDGANTNGGGTPKGASQTPTSNGGLLTGSFIQQKPTTDLMKKPEDIVKELMEQRRQRSYPQFDFDKMDEDTDDDDDKDDDDGMDEEEQKMAYKIEFQRPSMPSNATSNSNGSKTGRAAASTGSFLAMVHQ